MARHQHHRRPIAELGLGCAVVLVGASLAGAAGLWSPAEMVGPDDDYDSIFPNVEVSPDGIAWVVWSGVDPVQMDEEVYCVRIVDFVQSPPERIHPNNAAMDRCPIMSMGSDGVPWVVWERYNSTLGYVQVVSHWTGSAWAPRDTVFTRGTAWDNYTIHASSSDDVWVAKSSRADGRADRDIFLRHWDGVSWGPVERVGFAGTGWEDTDPALTMDSDGRAWLTWMRFDMTTRLYRNFVYASVWDGEAWSEPALVDTGPSNLVVCDLNATPDGRPLAVWHVGFEDAVGSDLKYATLGEAGWEHGGLVNQPDDPNADDDGGARMSRGPDGDLWVAWTSSVWGATPNAITASRWLGGSWGEEELVSAPDMQSLKNDNSPRVAVAGDGRVWAVWKRQQETSPYDTDIYVAHRDVTTPVDVWELTAEAVGGSVQLTWRASPEVAQAGLHVWRASGDACSGEATGIPGAAGRLTGTPVRDCTACTFVDDAVLSGATYCYWLEQPGSDRVFGPVEARTPAAPGTVSFSVLPNPAGDGVVFHVAGLGSPGEIRIFTVGGRAVATLPLPEGTWERQRDEVVAVPWNGRDGAGSAAPSGVFYAVLRERESGGALARVRFVLVR
jgi:hypothetical protein